MINEKDKQIYSFYFEDHEIRASISEMLDYNKKTL